MRVVAGTARGRKIVAPDGDDTRPTSDRVREAIFNSLYSLGGVDGWSVVDLFAGSGAMGIEAISRGAGFVEFVERSPKAIAAIGSNLESLDLEDRAKVTRGDVFQWRPSRPFDVAVIDPPYTFDQWEDLLANKLADLLVIESGKGFRPPVHLETIRVKQYGATVVSIVRQD